MNARATRKALGAIAMSWLLASAAAAVPEDVAYVSTPEGVTVIDLARLEAVKQIDVGGKGPRGMAITPDGKTLLTANQDTADVSLVDTGTFKVVRRIPIGKNPEFLRIEPDGKTAYVTYEPGSTGGPPKKGEKEEGGTPAEVAVIDLQKGAATSFLMGGMETEGIEFSPDGKSIAVANEGNDTLAVYDRLSGKPIKTLDVKPWGSRPRGIKVSPDGSRYIVTLENSDNFLVFDADFKFIKSVPTEKGPYGISFDRAGKRILIAAARSKALQVFDAATLAPLATVPIGARCWHFSFTPDDAKIIAACGRSNDLYVIDAAKYQPLKVISGLKLPWGVITYPKSYGTMDTP